MAIVPFSHFRDANSSHNGDPNGCIGPVLEQPGKHQRQDGQHQPAQLCHIMLHYHIVKSIRSRVSESGGSSDMVTTGQFSDDACAETGCTYLSFVAVGEVLLGSRIYKHRQFGRD